MAIDGSKTPGRMPVAPVPPPFVTLEGDATSDELDAYDLTSEFVDAYRNGLRDLRNPELAAFYEETPRSRVSNADVAQRYRAIQEAATELGIEPASLEEFVSLFLPNGASGKFIENLGSLGMESLLVNDWFKLSATQLAFANAQTTTLIGEQVGAGRTQLTAVISALLISMDSPLDVTETTHFAEDQTENNAIDVDDKAHERLFKGFGRYVELAVKLA